MTNYYDEKSVSVTDTVFITPSGDQYPIRNISSVMVRQFPERLALIIGVLCILAQIVLFIDSKSSPSLVFLIVGLIALAWWYFKRKYVLFIGSGGTMQEALSFPMYKGNRVDDLQKISNAINRAIAGLQKT